MIRKPKQTDLNSLARQARRYTIRLIKSLAKAREATAKSAIRFGALSLLTATLAHAQYDPISLDYLRAWQIGAAAKPWTPADLESGLAAWYDAADAGTLWADTSATTPATNGGVVARWDDKSGNDWHVTQSDTEALPTLGTNEVQMPEDQYLFVSPGPLPTGSGAKHIFAVINDIAGGASVAFMAQEVNTWAAAGVGYRITREPAVRYSNLTTFGGGAFGDGESLISVLYDSGDNGNQIRYVVNGTARTVTGGINSPLVADATGLYLGSDYATAVNPNGGADFRELIVTTHAEMTLEMQQKIEGYLAWKWGIQDNLPSAHPYKNNAP